MAATLLPADITSPHLTSIGVDNSAEQGHLINQEGNTSACAIEQRLNETMRQSQYRQLARINCRVDQGIATLHGQVSSFFLKQLAQEQAARVGNVLRVVNLVEVVDL